MEETRIRMEELISHMSKQENQSNTKNNENNENNEKNEHNQQNFDISKFDEQIEELKKERNHFKEVS